MTKSLSSKILLYYSLKYQGDWDKIYNAVREREYVDSETAENTFNAFTGNFITILDEEYPDSLKQVVKPPFVLFYEGDINLLKEENIIAISHVKYTDREDLKEAKSLLENDKPLTYLLGGTENDLDDYIISIGKKTIAVIGTALFLNTNHKANLILTEIPNNVLEKTKDGLMGRYRIMAGIAHKQLVLSRTKLSGSTVLTNFMCTLNKEVMVVPKNIMDDNYANNELLYEGATPICSSWQLA